MLASFLFTCILLQKFSFNISIIDPILNYQLEKLICWKCYPKCFRSSKPLLSRENKSFQYFASKTEPSEIEEEVEKEETKSKEKEEEEERLEELMEQATQEFRSYIKNQVSSIFFSKSFLFIETKIRSNRFDLEIKICGVTGKKRVLNKNPKKTC